MAGGDTIVRTDANGRFTLTGVPTGIHTISAGVERNPAAGLDFPRLGSASLNIVAGVENFVVVRLRPAGRITGRVDMKGEFEWTTEAVPSINLRGRTAVFSTGPVIVCNDVCGDGSTETDALYAICKLQGRVFKMTRRSTRVASCSSPTATRQRTGR